MNIKNNIPEYGVTEFNKIFRETIESNFNYVRIRGEISELRTATKGQIYISIKDENSVLSAVIWESKIKYLSMQPEIGMEVVVIGKITTWSRYKSTYQLDIDNLEIAGEGALLKLIEERKKKLAAKGMFDEKFKKQVPFLPNKIGIITSPTGSVIYDILNILKERFPTKVDLWPTYVQGDGAAEIIINAIKFFNHDSYDEKPEVIIIARGGGSVEDLMVFNDEKLALAVFDSKIPIVSAIGHETDTTIIDFVSDLRAPTPTAAAEKVVPIRSELIIQINKYFDRLLNPIDRKINYLNDFFNSFVRLIKDPKYILDDYKKKYMILNKDFTNSYKILFNKKNQELQNNFSKLKIPNELINLKKIQSQNIFKTLNFHISQKVKDSFFYIQNINRLLQSNSINNNLKKRICFTKKIKKNH